MAAPTVAIDICNLALDMLKQNKTLVESIVSPSTVEETTCARWYDTTREALLRSHYWLFARKRAQILRVYATVTGATVADPVVITAVAHGFIDGDSIRITDAVGMTEINDTVYIVASAATNTFELNDIEGNDIDGSAFTAWTSGGVISPYTFGYADAYQLPSNYLKLHFIGNDSIRNYKGDYEYEGDRLLLNNSTSLTLDIGYIRNITDVTKFDPLFVILLAAEMADNMAYKWTLKNTVIQRLEQVLTNRRAEAKAVNGQDRPPKRIQKSRWTSARSKLSTSVADKFTRFDD